MALQLVIGDKNYSSWSLRAALAVELAGVECEEVLVRLYQPDSRAQLLRHSPTGKVPVLLTEQGPVWDSLAIAEYTPIFNWLSAPIVPLLELLQLPEAAKAAPAMLVGFADMFLPAVLGKGIESELTRFVVACVSLTQLIYMSEVGVLIIKAKLPLNLLELFVIFIIRTLITLPIIALMAHWIVG